MSDSIEETHKVLVVRDRKTSNITGEYWAKEDGTPHRVFGPAVSEFDPVSGQLLKEIYYLRGEIHRREGNGPAVREWSSTTGKLTYVEFSEYGEHHRTDGEPAIIYYNPHTGEVLDQEYYVSGEKRSSSPPPPEYS